MTDRHTIRLVVYFLGAAVLLGGLATYLLAQRVLDQSAGAGTVDAAAVGVVAIPAGFTTGALGFLGGILASTRSVPDKGEIDAALAPLMLPAAPLPVLVKNTERDPARVADVDRPPDEPPLPAGVVPRSA